MKTRRTHTITLTVSAPAWLSAAACRREVRSLINESTPWGTVQPGHYFNSIDHGDIKVRKIAPGAAATARAKAGRQAVQDARALAKELADGLHVTLDGREPL